MLVKEAVDSWTKSIYPYGVPERVVGPTSREVVGLLLEKYNRGLTLEKVRDSYVKRRSIFKESVSLPEMKRRLAKVKEVELTDGKYCVKESYITKNKVFGNDLVISLILKSSTKSQYTFKANTAGYLAAAKFAKKAGNLNCLIETPLREFIYRD